MAIAKPTKVAGQSVVSMFWFKRLSVNKSNNQALDFFRIFASSDHEIEIFLELVSIDNGKHQIPSFEKSSSVLLVEV